MLHKRRIPFSTRLPERLAVPGKKHSQREEPAKTVSHTQELKESGLEQAAGVETMATEQAAEFTAAQAQEAAVLESAEAAAPAFVEASEEVPEACADVQGDFADVQGDSAETEITAKSLVLDDFPSLSAAADKIEFEIMGQSKGDIRLSQTAAAQLGAATARAGGAQASAARAGGAQAGAASGPRKAAAARVDAAAIQSKAAGSTTSELTFKTKTGQRVTLPGLVAKDGYLLAKMRGNEVPAVDTRLDELEKKLSEGGQRAPKALELPADFLKSIGLGGSQVLISPKAAGALRTILEGKKNG